MARDFFCERLVLTSDGGVREIDLAHAVVCVVGPIDTGKTTLADCIKYALGLPVAWREVPGERLQTVTLFVRIEGMRSAAGGLPPAEFERIINKARTKANPQGLAA